MDVSGRQLRTMHLFAGAGGGILADLLLGHVPVCAVEINPYCRQVLIQRQRDGILPRFPIWDDVRTFDGKPWRGSVDCVSGGFPCVDISLAGHGAGIEGEHSGLWREMARIIRDVEPAYVFVENSPALTIRGMGRVLGDLATLGFNAEWGVLGAVDAGAPHQRERIWLVADAKSKTSQSCRKRSNGKRRTELPRKPRGSDWWADEPGLARVANGVAGTWMDRISASGNGQVPAVAALAWRILSGRLAVSHLACGGGERE